MFWTSWGQLMRYDTGYQFHYSIVEETFHDQITVWSAACHVNGAHTASALIQQRYHCIVNWLPQSSFHYCDAQEIMWWQIHHDDGMNDDDEMMSRVERWWRQEARWDERHKDEIWRMVRFYNSSFLAALSSSSSSRSSNSCKRKAKASWISKQNVQEILILCQWLNSRYARLKPNPPNSTDSRYSSSELFAEMYIYSSDYPLMSDHPKITQ